MDKSKGSKKMGTSGKAKARPSLNLTATSASWDVLELGLALATAFLIGTRYVLYRQLVIGYFVSFALFPLWIPLARKLVGARALFVFALVGLASGTLLQWVNSADHAVDSSLAVINAVELIGVFSAAAALYWAIKKLGLGWTLVAFGAGMILFVERGSGLYSTGPWRYGYALPVAILTFGIATVVGRRWFEVVVLVALTGAAMASGSRSVFGVLLLTMMLIVIGWLRRRRLKRSSSVVLTGGLLLMLAVALVNLGQALLLEGYLGEAAQQRTIVQVDQSGSVLLGGRPELGATVALILSRVWGMGLGIMPNWSDIQAARAGMAQNGYDPNNGYVDNYMFGEGFRLHSMFGDLWANFGIPGLLIVALVLWLCVKTLSLGSHGVGDAAMLYVTFQTIWNAFFAPWYSGILMLIVFLALAWHRFEAMNVSDELTPVTST